MPDFDVYFGDDEGIDATSRAGDAWTRIKRNPTSIVLVRGATTMAAQIVRIEFSGVGEEAQSEAGRVGRQRVVIFGVINHPTEDDTNIQRGDRFAVEKKQYEVVTVIKPPGEVQAFCEAIA